MADSVYSMELADPMEAILSKIDQRPTQLFQQPMLALVLVYFTDYRSFCGTFKYDHFSVTEYKISLLYLVFSYVKRE